MSNQRASKRKRKPSPVKENRAPRHRKLSKASRYRWLGSFLAGNWWAGIAGIAAVIGLGLALWPVLKPAGNDTTNVTPFPSVTPYPVGAESSASSGPNGPVLINSAVQILAPVAAGSAVFPKVIQLNKIQLARINQQNRVAYEQLIASQGGVEPGISLIQIPVTGNAATPARITNIDIIDKTCQQPLTGTLFDTGGAQGEAPTIPINFNLDALAPVALTPAGQDFFAMNTITLKPGEQQTLVIAAFTKYYYCRYKIQLVVLVGSHQTLETITYHGRPFQTTVEADYNQYHKIYAGGLLDPQGEGAFVAVNPASYQGGSV